MGDGVDTKSTENSSVDGIVSGKSQSTCLLRPMLKTGKVCH